MQHVAHALRLTGYATIARIAMLAMFKKLKPHVFDIPQFDKMPSFAKVAFLAPILEEPGFTYAPVFLFGAKAQMFMPLFFGAAHYHKEPNKYFFLMLQTGIVNFFNCRSLEKNKGYIYAPVLSHMMHNIAWYLLVKNDIIR